MSSTHNFRSIYCQHSFLFFPVLGIKLTRASCTPGKDYHKPHSQPLSQQLLNETFLMLSITRFLLGYKIKVNLSQKEVLPRGQVTTLIFPVKYTIFKHPNSKTEFKEITRTSASVTVTCGEVDKGTQMPAEDSERGGFPV